MAYCLTVPPTEWSSLDFAWQELPECDVSPTTIQASARRLCPVLSTDCMNEVFMVSPRFAHPSGDGPLRTFAAYLGELQSLTLSDDSEDVRMVGLRKRCRYRFRFDLRPEVMDVLMLIIAGVPMATCRLSVAHDADASGQVSHWEVHELVACTGRGAGTRLMKHVQSMCEQSMGAERMKIRLCSIVDSFYEKLGFRVMPYEDDIDGGLMVWPGEHWLGVVRQRLEQQERGGSTGSLLPADGTPTMRTECQRRKRSHSESQEEVP